ncbi:TraV family lipoprotein [Rugamonas aquatica]|uniref:TraV family lipoprotein n=1 Tax=Rugamonas aquatica TaxID=2743357 RepID=UPI0015820DDE|nr:TraV family lipoprotein [Rugamonas aquatica]
MKPSVSSVGATALVLLAGCGDLSGLGGSDHYACKAPEGVRCDSLAGNYANSLHNNLPSQTAARSGPAPASPQRRPPAAASLLAPLAGEPGAVRALRSDERLLRLWIKRWRDRDNDLYDESYLYMKVESGHWLIDAAQERSAQPYRVLRAPRGNAPATVPATAVTTLPGPVMPPALPPQLPGDINGAPPLAPELPEPPAPMLPPAATPGR